MSNSNSPLTFAGSTSNPPRDYGTTHTAEAEPTHDSERHGTGAMRDDGDLERTFIEEAIETQSIDTESSGSDTDEPLNVLISEHGAPMASLGLSGGMDLFGTSMARRKSVSLAVRDETATDMAAQRRASSASAFKGRRASTATFAYRKLRRESVGNARRNSDDIFPIPVLTDGGSKYLHPVGKGQFRGIFVGMLLTWFVASFDSTLMASSHPVITSYFHASNAAAWLSTSFLLTSTALQPTFGQVSDTFGRKAPFLFSMVIFTVGTAFCGVAQSIVQFILARALCGLGAGGAMALGVIIISDIIPLRNRAPYLAVLNLANGIGTSLGAALGGFLADTIGWRWEFGIQVPALAACLILTAFFLPSKLGPCLYDSGEKGFLDTLRDFDLLGSLLLTLTVTFLILGLNIGGNILPWSHLFVISSLALTVVFAVLLILTELRVARPIMPLHILTNGPSTRIILSNFFGCVTMNTVLFNVPLFLQGTLLDSPTESGLRLILPFGLGMIASFATGWVIDISDRVTPSMISGAVLILAGSISLTFMPQLLPDAAYSWLIAITTVGQGINFPTYSIGISAVTQVDDIAMAMSTLFLFRNLGNILGVAVSSVIAQNALVHYLHIFVKGPGTEKVIESVIKSVESIASLGQLHQGQVIEAYRAALRLAFGQGAVSALCALVLVIGIKLLNLSAYS